MATEVTVKVRDSQLGQAFFVQQDEWELCLSQIRSILREQEVKTPDEYRFLTGNGNVVSPALEATVTFREVVEKEPFAEIKKEDSSLHSAEQRVVPQIILVATSTSTDNGTSQGQEEVACPFIRKFPCLMGAKDKLPCMRNVFNVHTLLKIAFLLTCLLFLMIFVLTLGVHLLFGIGTVGGLIGHGFPGMTIFPHQHQVPDHSEALTTLKIKLSEIEVANRFEIQDLKRKFAELEDLYLRDLDLHRKELAKLEASQARVEKDLGSYVHGFSVRMDGVQNAMRERWTKDGIKENSADDVLVEKENTEGQKPVEVQEEVEAEEVFESPLQTDAAAEDVVVVEDQVQGNGDAEGKQKEGKKEEKKNKKHKEEGKKKGKDKGKKDKKNKKQK